MSILHITPGYRQAQTIARQAFTQREAAPVQSFRRWTLASLLLKRAYYATHQQTEAA